VAGCLVFRVCQRKRLRGSSTERTGAVKCRGGTKVPNLRSSTRGNKKRGGERGAKQDDQTRGGNGKSHLGG